MATYTNSKKGSKHSIQMQPNTAAKICTVVRNDGDFVWLELPNGDIFRCNLVVSAQIRNNKHRVA